MLLFYFIMKIVFILCYGKVLLKQWYCGLDYCQVNRNMEAYNLAIK